MVPFLRQAFNNTFTREKYEAFLKDLHSPYPGAIDFRIAETPVFIPKTFAAQLTDTCEYIIDVITDPEFKQRTERSIPDSDRVPHENAHSHFLAFDFGVCVDETGQWQPQLIEMQGFASLYGFQVFYPDILRRHFDIPENYSQYLNGLDRDSYLSELRTVVLGSYAPEEVILLELRPHEQKTRIDFYCTQDYLGIQVVDLLELIQEGKKLYYINAGTGKKTLIKRIYNRVIFDELNAAGHYDVDIRSDLDVEFVAHPNWFYRISKFLLPYLHHPHVPDSFFLNEIKQPPADLENYVLKPLFSFAGQGVVIDVTHADLEKIEHPENWILQRKVTYADLVPTPDIPAKVEIRMMYLWKDGDARPTLAINLARLSKGKMIGVRYNKDKEWVGGSVCFFER
ncbi:MAG: hypothetical protein J0H74_32000 [Chitinophagaceae bacterium]|nr:hypothetical protein [Chitinophagaceae bacterium]